MDGTEIPDDLPDPEAQRPAGEGTGSTGDGFVSSTWNSISSLGDSVASTAQAGFGAAYSKWEEIGGSLKKIDTNTTFYKELFGPTLVDTNNASVTIEAALGNGKYVALYFGAEWAGPCGPFTQALMNVYEKVNAKQDEACSLQVVYVSADKNQEQFNNYVKTMPWVSVPFPKLQVRKKVMKLYKAATLPKFILLSPSGKLLTEDEKWVSLDTDGAKFPWEGSSDQCIIA